MQPTQTATLEFVRRIHMARTLSVTFFPINLAIHKFSFWAIYKAGHYKVTGPEVRQAVDAARPGDDLLCRYDGHLDKGFTSVSRHILHALSSKQRAPLHRTELHAGGHRCLLLDRQ